MTKEINRETILLLGQLKIRYWMTFLMSFSIIALAIYKNNMVIALLVAMVFVWYAQRVRSIFQYYAENREEEE